MMYNSSNKHSSHAFTLIEMIGVLAVIGILAALLVPKIFEAINSARVNNAAISCATVKTAVADHYGKYGSFLVDASSGTPVTFDTNNVRASEYDRVLLSEGFLDKPFAVRIGDGIAGPTNTHIQVVAAEVNTTNPNGTNPAYDLDWGSATNTFVNDAAGSLVIEAVITGVQELDAKELNDRIDGIPLGAPLGTNDFYGRVKYAMGNPTAVHVYLTHR